MIDEICPAGNELEARTRKIFLHFGLVAKVLAGKTSSAYRTSSTTSMHDHIYYTIRADYLREHEVNLRKE